MKAREIQPGDVLPGSYTVLDVDVVPSHVKAHVRFEDGGDGYRVWDDTTAEVPLIRPARAR